MNIIRLTNSFPSIEKQAGLPGTYDISLEQVSLGHKVFVITRGSDLFKEYETIRGIAVFRVNSPYNLLAFKKILSLDKRYPVDILHSHATACQYLPLLKNLFRAKKLKHITHVHGTTRGISNSLKLFDKNEEKSLGYFIMNNSSVIRESLIWKKTDGLIAVSESVKLELKKLYGIRDDKIFVVNNGVNINLFRPLSNREKLLKKLGYSPRTNLILYLGWFRAIKGPEILIRAYNIVQKKCHNTRLLLVSGPITKENIEYGKKLFSLIKKLGLNEVVEIREKIPYTSLPEYYSASRLVVIPSIHESFPKVPLEAMACGTPVVASNVGGIPQILGDGSGIIVPPMSVEDLSQGIIEIISNKKLSNEISRLARKRIIDNFSWKDRVKDIMKVYRKIYYGF